jgi:uncharacterized protein YbcI
VFFRLRRGVGMLALNNEQLIREGFIKIFKKYVGKGPQNTEVRIFKKMVIVVMQCVLTSLEKNLISTGNEEAVTVIRDKIAEPAIVEYKKFLEGVTSKKIVDMMAKNNFASDERYYVFIFDENIE